MMAMTTPKTQPRPILKQTASTNVKQVRIFQFSDSDDSEQSSNELSIKLEKSSINEKDGKNRRENSSTYVLHNHHKIAKDLVEVILESTDKFLKHVDKELNGIYNRNSKLSKTRHKEVFLKKLKEFLVGSTNSDSKLSDINQRNKDIVKFMCKNELALSNPDITIKHQNVSVPKIPLKNISPISKLLREEKCMTVSSSLPGCNFLINNIHQRANHLFIDSINKESSFAGSKSKISFFDIQKGNFETDELIEANKTTKKIVRFADSLGLDLENVRVISSFSNNNSFIDAFDYYKNRSSIRSIEDSFYIEPKAKVKTLILIPNFFLAPNFDTESNCKLADFLFDTENKILKLLIRVRNISYEKHVFVRFTFNNWKNSNDIEAIYTKITNLKTFTSLDVAGDVHDYFIVTIFVPDCEQNQTYNTFETTSNYFYIEFAIFYKTNSDTHWDNNFGKNYSFQCINQLL